MADRMPQLSDDVPAIGNIRTEAQAAASRANGSCSRGPVMVEGKARSRRNALRHGLLAKVVAPPDNPLGHRRAYQQLRKQLIAQFTPVTATAQADIDGLASDLLRAARCRQFIELALQGPVASPGDARQLRECRGVRRDLTVAARLQRVLERNDRPDCTPSEAARLAERLADAVAAVANDVAEADAEAAEIALEVAGCMADTPKPGAPGVPDGTPDPARGRSDDAARRVAAAEEAELSGLRRFLGVLGPRLEQYQDSGWLIPLFTGARRVSAADRRRLLAVLGYWMPQTRVWLAGQVDREQKVEQVQLANLATVAAAPDRAMVWEVYLGRIERLIDLKLQRLRVA